MTTTEFIENVWRFWFFLIEEPYILAACILLFGLLNSFCYKLISTRSMPDLNLFYKHVQLNDLLSVCVVVYGATTVLCFAVCTCFVEYPGDGAIYILTNNSWKKLDGCAHHKFLAFDGYKLTESSIDLPQTIKVPLEKGKTIEVYYHIKKGNILIVLNEIGPSVWTEFSFQCDNYFTPVIQKIFYTEVAQIPEDNEEQRLQSWKKLLSSYGVTVDRVEVY